MALCQISDLAVRGGVWRLPTLLNLYDYKNIFIVVWIAERRANPQYCTWHKAEEMQCNALYTRFGSDFVLITYLQLSQTLLNWFVIFYNQLKVEFRFQLHLKLIIARYKSYWSKKGIHRRRIKVITMLTIELHSRLHSFFTFFISTVTSYQPLNITSQRLLKIVDLHFVRSE